MNLANIREDLLLRRKPEVERVEDLAQDSKIEEAYQISFDLFSWTEGPARQQ